MSINMILSQIKRLESDISGINQKVNTQKSKEAKATDKIAKAQKKILDAKTSSAVKSSAQRDYEAGTKALTAA